jgi:preprotein translocase subunit SecY
MLESVQNAFKLPDLRRRLLFTLGIIVVFRLAAHVPTPGVDTRALSAILESGALLGWLNLLSGGALENFSVVAMGVYPYITASIIMQMITPLVPALQELSKEGEQGRNRLNQYTYWLSIPLAMIQAVAQVFLINEASTTAGPVISEFGLGHPLRTATLLITLTGGTMFSLWLGELITSDGIGNGVSIIIFSGIVAGIPQGFLSLIGSAGAMLVILALTVGTVGAIVVVQEGHRRVPVQYGKRVRGTKLYGGQATHIPLRVNSAGMIPLIFASSILIFPGVMFSALQSVANPTISSTAAALNRALAPDSGGWFLLYFVLVVLFTFFYTDVVFRQQNLHETLQRQGGFIPGIRPGKRTEDYLNSLMRRLTLAGGVFLGAVAVMPWLAQVLTGQTAVLIQATGLLIVVGVVLDTMKQLEAQLLMRHYEGFIR